MVVPDGTLLAHKGVNLNKDGAMKREKGFTLLELMVTIVILCILLGLAIPGFSRWVPNYRLRGAARDIYSNFQLAKLTAVRDRARCGVVFDVANGRYQVIRSGPNRTFESTSSAVGGDDVVLKTVNFSEYGSGVGYGPGSATASIDGVGFDNNVTFVGDGVVFDSRGMVLSPTGAISTGGYAYLKNSKNSAYGVGVLSGGVVVLRRWTGSTWQQ
jgi:prepilin-type N-terminal cleavage/methylation domain-containing protein